MNPLPIILGLVLHCVVWPQQEVYTFDISPPLPSSFLMLNSMDNGPSKFIMFELLKYGERLVQLRFEGQDCTKFDGFYSVSNIVLETTFKPTVTGSNGHWTVKLQQ